jgi:hypothetical protein
MSNRRPISDEADRELLAETRAAVGADASDELQDPGDRPRGGSVAGASMANMAPLLIVGLGLGVALLVAAAISGIWWLLAIAFVADVAGGLFVARMAMTMADQTEKPSATTEARLEEEGVANPERAGSELADEYRRAS